MLPWFGQNFAAVTDMTVAADVVVNAAAPLMDSVEPGGLDAFIPNDGKMDLQSVQELTPKLTRAASTANAAHDSLTAIDEERLVPQLSQPLDQATSALDTVRQSLDGASSAAEVLPSMLGADGDRNFLMLVQNNAEVRATGGIAGALVVLKTSDGEIELTDHGSASDLGRFNPPLDVDEEQEKIYSTRIGGFMQSVNLTPDFPTAARTAQSMWEEKNADTEIDGVLAIDPVVLSYLLEATGPVKLSSLNELPVDTGQLPVTLTADNVTETLLSDVYREVEEPSAQDAYFAAVAEDVFSGMTSGAADPVKLVKAIQKSMEDQRLFVWSESEAEQEVIGDSVLGGSVATKEPSIGVYFNDGTGAKMDFYVQREVQLLERCQPDGYYRYAVQTTLTNTAPADAAESLPDYVTGGGAFGVDPGTVKTNVYVYGPAEWFLDGASRDGDTVPFGSYRHGASHVGGVTVALKPGESTTVEFEFSTLFETAEPELRVTPTIQSLSDVVKSTSSASDCTS
ncbi:Protein of unknown function (DUF4012) [Arthrobacter sp. VKM Ac-2550]|nr:Protein of unknown function (DUF4012) [Arthrobacter sp. VKM Ac-2550]